MYIKMFFITILLVFGLFGKTQATFELVAAWNAWKSLVTEEAAK
jgi:hypothetical protein